jgi:trimeric autotransporter adhesin
VQLAATADIVNPQDQVTVLAANINVPPGAANVSFKLAAQTPDQSGGPTFLVVSPSSGVTPATVYVGLDPNIVPYLPAGAYGVNVEFTAIQSSAAIPGCSFFVDLSLRPPGPPSVTSVVSSATFQPAISPGELVSIFGANIGTPPQNGTFDQTGLYPTTLGNTTVTFNGVAAPLLYVSNNQINTVAPYELAGQTTAAVVVTHDSQAAPAFSAPVVPTSPGIFTLTGTGQGVIVNASGPSGPTFNSAANPAPQGSAITFFATGAGLWNQTIQDGIVILGSIQPLIAPAANVSLTIGGAPAQILFAGAEPFQITGMLQINAIVPTGIGSGPQPLVLTIGQNNNSQQQVTVAVQ